MPRNNYPGSFPEVRSLTESKEKIVRPARKTSREKSAGVLVRKVLYQKT